MFETNSSKSEHVRVPVRVCCMYQGGGGGGGLAMKITNNLLHSQFTGNSFHASRRTGNFSIPDHREYIFSIPLHGKFKMLFSALLKCSFPVHGKYFLYSQITKNSKPHSRRTENTLTHPQKMLKGGGGGCFRKTSQGGGGGGVQFEILKKCTPPPPPYLKSWIHHWKCLKICRPSCLYQGFGNVGAKISSEASYIHDRSELHIRAKRVTSEASINQLGVRAL